MKRVLLITYVFPPVGGAGVQRTLKWTKYLPEFGWKPYVLTAKNPSVPLFDKSLAEEIPSDIVVTRTRSFEPPYRLKRTAWNKAAKVASENQGTNLRTILAGAIKGVAQRIFFPDPQIGWEPTAYRAARRLIKAEKIDAILTSAPPFSTHLLGRRLAAKTGLPWVADFRDEWVDFYTRAYDFHRRKGAAKRIAQMEASVCQDTAALLTVTNGILSNYRKKYPRLNPSNSFWIPNGFDEADFSTPASTPPSDGVITLTYSGTIFEVTSAAPFLQALASLLDRRPNLRNRFRVRFQGRIDAREEAPFETPSLQGIVQRFGYVPHRESVGFIRSSDALLLLLSDLPGADRILTGKIFEYIAARKPILAVIPDGEAAELIRSTGTGLVVSPKDQKGIEAGIERIIEGSVKITAGGELHRFSRRETARELAHVLDGTHRKN